MKTTILLFALASLNLMACTSPEKKQEKPVLQKYHNATIGWTITVPEGFQLLSKSRMEANEAKGRAAIGADTNQTHAANGLQNIVNFQKNQFNLFNATLEKTPQQTAKTYASQHQVVKKLIFDAYAKQKIKVDTTSGKADFAGHPFHAFYLKIYGPNGSLIMNQAIYSALINGFDFGVSINYNNEADHASLVQAFQQSTFQQPKN